MKVLFMGTPAFAAASLQKLIESGHRIAGVVTRPDARSGRGLRTRPSPVKVLAEAHGLALLQPTGVKGMGFLEQVRALAPDLIVVVAFGRILPAALLDLPPHGAVNVHASLLPRYRGAAPVAWAIARGEQITGVTTMRMSPELDAGDILLQRETPIREGETTGQLERRLAVMGADLLVETLQQIEAGEARPVPQDHARATFAPRLKKQDGRIDWNMTAPEIERRVRAFDPWPVAQTTGPADRRILIWKARVAETPDPAAEPGTVLGKVTPGRGPALGVLVACGGGTALLVGEVQPEGSRRMPALQAVSGRHFEVGDRLGTA